MESPSSRLTPGTWESEGGTCKLHVGVAGVDTALSYFYYH